MFAEIFQAAARATTTSRMQMLAAAAVGVLIPDFDGEMRSRVARAVEQLEPSDVVALRRVKAAFDGGHSIQQVDGIPQNRIALLQTGCLLEHPEAGAVRRYEPTPVGFAILETLQLWPRSTGGTGQKR